MRSHRPDCFLLSVSAVFLAAALSLSAGAWARPRAPKAAPTTPTPVEAPPRAPELLAPEGDASRSAASPEAIPSKQVAVLPVMGAPSPRVQSELAAGWRNALADRGFQVVDPTRVDAASAAQGPKSPSELAPAVGRALAVGAVIATQVERRGGAYVVTALLARSAPGDQVSAGFVCKDCREDELLTRFAGFRDELLSADEQAHGSLAISSVPAEQAFTLDGALDGKTPPAENPAPPIEEIAARHVVQVKLSANRSKTVEVRLAQGENSDLKVDLSDLKMNAWKYAGAALVVAGVATAGAGAGLWAMDGRCARSSCVERYHTFNTGIALFGAGMGVAVVGAAAILYGYYAPKHVVQVLPYAGSNQAGLAVGGRF